ncbi:lipoprotein [Betaproteobacteria bacterium]|nr:lipoprotein [Betaproteobacteria bacterium]GHT94104.1 lipoprotein [Betaproteobacteria bacterium]GHU03169.1 lipoprotein [Betaproteobacteria bacterium]GHU12841.1 lipoprotein [Betaproteobacteria bacterium]GHU19757.1 lipoprotein [Betaproteobacteria bacterium]
MFSSLRRAVLLLCVAVLSTACQAPPPPPVEGLSAGQIGVLKNIGFEEIEDGWELNLGGRILFDSGDASLNDESRATVAHVIQVLREAGINHLRIEGYTDNTGPERHNQELSLQRATVVAREAVANGLPYENLTVEGRGASNPVADNQAPAGRAQNRRVALIVPIN